MRKSKPRKIRLWAHTRLFWGRDDLIPGSPTENSHVNVVWCDVAVRKHAIQKFSAADIDTFP